MFFSEFVFHLLLTLENGINRNVEKNNFLIEKSYIFMSQTTRIYL
jgi:hypothetical protein